MRRVEKYEQESKNLKTSWKHFPRKVYSTAQEIGCRWTEIYILTATGDPGKSSMKENTNKTEGATMNSVMLRTGRKH